MGALRAKVAPRNRLSLAERDAVMRVLNSDVFKDLAPSEIVPRLADAGQYVASESTMYRLCMRALNWLTDALSVCHAR